MRVVKDKGQRPNRDETELNWPCEWSGDAEDQAINYVKDNPHCDQYRGDRN